MESSHRPSFLNKKIIQKNLLNQRIKFLSQHLWISFPASLICATLLAIALYKVSNQPLLLTWYVSTIMILLIRMSILIRYRYKPQSDSLYLKLVIIGAWLSAAMWGLAGSILMPSQHDILTQLLTIVILSGVTAGALQTFRASFVTSFGYLVLSISPLIIWLLFQNQFIYMLISLSIITYFIFLTAVAWQGYQMINAMLLLRFQNSTLLNELSNTNHFLKNANQSLLESQQRFQSAFDFAAIGMGLVSIEWHWLSVNHSLCQLLGYDEKELLQTDFRSITYPNDLNVDSHYIHQMIVGDISAYKVEKRYIHKKGSLIWVLLNVSVVRNFKNEPWYFLAQIQDISIQKKAEYELEKMAYHDRLTNLGNRAQLEKDVRETIIKYKETNKKFAFMMLDLDYFKYVNDTLGHDAGDELLIKVAAALKSTVRYTDKITRLGGDEFVIIVLNIVHGDELINIAQKILDNIFKPIIIKGHKIYITTSLGVSLYPNDGHDINTLMKNADLCLYRAKKFGRNNFQFYTTELQKTVKEKMLRKQSIHDALLNHEFSIDYQPRMSMETYDINSFEALLRWRSMKYGNVPPDQIIPLAEEINLIDALSKWIFKTAFSQIKIWNAQRKRLLTVSINLSPKEFLQIDFVERVSEMLKIYDLPPNSLEFEINEHILMQDPVKHIPSIRALKKLGIQIAIDDFGTSYTSLEYLKEFSIDRIKIDRSFIREITYNDNSRSVVKAMIAMSFELGIKTVAMGVETIEQYHLLSQYGCNEIQGYYLSKPLPPELASRFIEEESVLLQV